MELKSPVNVREERVRVRVWVRVMHFNINIT
jgi:hypothetical protein